MKTKCLIIIASLLLGNNTYAIHHNENVPLSKSIHIIPQPLKLEQKSGAPFLLTPKTNIVFTEGLKPQAQYMQEVFARSTGWDLKTRQGKTKKGIFLSIDTIKVPKAEGYLMKVTEKHISIVAHDASGVFYGIQTLLQLLPPSIHSQTRQYDISWTVPPVCIEDAPERPWRGMMLDVARYFFDKQFVKKYIDMMAMYKLNKLQFHFIDDSGWRLEIKKYPKLTEIGAWAGTDTHRLGGFYTQEDIREIIEYASTRGVEIIPEIEFPAHMLSAVSAYPWLSCTEKRHEVPVQHFISRDLLCVGKPSSYQFLSDVLEETVSLFPSKYINIGGDEAVYTNWEKCEKCQEVMKRKKITKASQLQGFLTDTVATMMAKKDRTVVGWEEIFIRGKVSTPVVGVIWHNVADTIKAKNEGHKAILSPCTHMYYDFPEGKTPGEVKAATWNSPISLEKTYSMPINDYSPTSTTLGVQGCFWSDQFIHGTLLQEIPYLNENRSEKYAEYFTFPRLLALAEVAWKKESERNFEDFINRLSFHYERLDHKQCGYRIPEPLIKEITKLPTGQYEYILQPSVANSTICYTTNGEYPTPFSSRYVSPVTVESKDLFRAMTVLSPTRYSLPIYEAQDFSAYKQYGNFTCNWKSRQMQKQPAPFKFDCSGKITENGKYEVNIIYARGDGGVKFGKLKVLKRNETIAESTATSDILTVSAPIATYYIDIKDFEAGTPFHIAIETNVINEKDVQGMIFIKKK